jgi:hypothetical protein
MIHEKLLEEFDQIDEEMFNHSTKYLLEVINSSKYSSSLRDWFKTQPIIYLNKLEQSKLEDLYDALPHPTEVDDKLRTPVSYKTSVIPYSQQKPGFGKLCLVRIFYYGLDYFIQQDVPLTWKGFTSHLEKEAPSYPLDKLPFLNYEYHPDTIAAAQQAVGEWTSSHSYYINVENWFKKGKYKTFVVRERGKILREFPSKLDTNYATWRSRSPKEDWDYFTELCCQMAFNYYAEEFLGLLLPFDHNIKRKHDPKEHAHELALMIGVDMATYPDESVIAQINQHFENANIHFRKVENDMNTLDAYIDVPSVQVQLIHGKPADKYTEAELMSLIRNARKAQDDIRDLVNTSTRVKAKHEALEANIAVYVAALDALAE